MGVEDLYSLLKRGEIVCKNSEDCFFLQTLFVGKHDCLSCLHMEKIISCKVA
jgi:hypothetical protein